nr:hypothetical protein [Candidatus Njordarchaeota archaeon]
MAMNNKISKATPLLLILLMCLPLTFAPTNAMSYSAPGIYNSNTPDPTPWIQDSSKYASYNGHFSTRESSSWHYVGNNTSAILVANLTVKSAGTGYSNLSLGIYEFFTAKLVPGVSGLWYKISTSTGYVADSSGHSSDLNWYPCFFYLPSATDLMIDDKVKISTPFYYEPIDFRVNKTETILGIQTIQLVNETDLNLYNSVTESFHCSIALWFSNDTNGLLMRVKGWEYDYFGDVSGWRQHSLDVSMQVFKTNILTLTLPPIPSTQAVPWMRPGRYIQYNLQGYGWIDPKVTNQTGSPPWDTWELPGDAKFRATVSSNVTIKVERATTGYIDPWRETRWVWVVHVMLNNTQLLLPDFSRGIDYVNTTFNLNMPLTVVNELLSDLSQFNRTGLVLETYFLVDNGTGVVFTPGMHMEPPEPFNATKYGLGEWFSRGYAFLILQYVAQSFLNETWSQSANFELHDPSTPDTYYRVNENVTQRLDFSLNASARVVGTEYLTFPEGGGGNCWKLVNSVNASFSAIQNYNGTPTQPVANATIKGATSGYIDIERFSGFPLKFQQHLSVNSTGTAFIPSTGWTLNWTGSLCLDLSLLVPRSNIMWVSYPTVKLILGAGNNATMPPGYFRQYGFHVTMNNATNVEITGSASPPPDTADPPSGMAAFIYLSIIGEFIPGTSVVTLYVFVNRSLVLSLGIDEYSLKLYTWNSTAAKWDELMDPQGHPASHYVYINATHGCIMGYLYHLSYFAVLGTPPSGVGGLSTTLILIAAVAVIVVVVAAVVLIRRRRHQE